MYSTQTPPNKYENRLRRINSSVSLIKLGNFFLYTTKNTFRSNKFISAYLFMYLFLSLAYLGYAFIISIIPAHLSNFIWISIALFDIFLKYYMPGVFIEYIYPLLHISFNKSIVSFYIILNVIFNYANIIILLSLFFENNKKNTFLILSILTINHIIVLLFKLTNSSVLKNNTILSIVTIALFNLICISLTTNTILNLNLSIVVLIYFIYYTNNNLYVK